MHRSSPEAVPADVITCALPAYSTSRSTRTCGYLEASSSAYIQCVVAVSPSRMPAAARANEPVQRPTTRAPWPARPEGRRRAIRGRGGPKLAAPGR